MGYTIAGIKHLVSHYPVNVYLIGWDKKKLTPYIVDLPPNVTYKPRSAFQNFHDLFSYAQLIRPDGIFVSGWMDKDYVRVARAFKKQGIITTAFIDNQWSGTLRQLIGSFLSPLLVKRDFNNVWVSGVKQELFAAKMGFRPEEIYSGFYTADTDFFHQVYRDRQSFIKKNGYPRNITFVGRLAAIKNVKNLVETFIENKSQFHPWTLTIIGNGPMKEEILRIGRDHPEVCIKDFMQPHHLREDILLTGIFCLPSINEPWGVVIHEFAAAGIPLVVAKVCGAATEFVEEGRNGYLMDPENKNDLKEKLIKMTSLPTEQLMQMGEVSYELSHRITPSTWSNVAMRILKSPQFNSTSFKSVNA